MRLGNMVGGLGSVKKEFVERVLSGHESLVAAPSILTHQEEREGAVLM